MFFHPKFIALEPASTTNAATASLVIDRLGQDAVYIVANLSSANVVSNVPAIKLQEADVTNTSSYADVTGATTTQLNPSAVFTNAVYTLGLNVDCKARK